MRKLKIKLTLSVLFWITGFVFQTVEQPVLGFIGIPMTWIGLFAIIGYKQEIKELKQTQRHDTHNNTGSV